jgi:hypothetical protein
MKRQSNPRDTEFEERQGTDPLMDRDLLHNELMSAARWDGQSPDKAGHDYPPIRVWPVPRQIDGALPTVETYQSDMMPLAFRDWIADTAHRMQVPPDYLAATLVTLCGSLIGARCAVKPKAHDRWSVVPNLWGMIIGDPSQLKTPSTSEVMAFLRPLEQQARQDFAERKANYELESEIQAADRKRLEREMKDKDKIVREKAKAELSELNKVVSPLLKRYMVNDCTPEKLAELCAENPQGLLSFRDEIVGLLKSLKNKGKSWRVDSTWKGGRVQAPILLTGS